MSIKWVSSNPDTLIHRIQVRADSITDEMVDIMQVSVEEAHGFQAQALDESTTSYGEQRYGAGRGGSAGRNDTGTMIDRIEHDVEVDGNTVRGWWGWDEPEDYFLAQEFGIGNPPPALSLRTSFVAEREKITARINQLGKSN